VTYPTPPFRTPLLRPHALMGLLFYPRGGSAQVVRALAGELPAQGWDATIVASSVRGAGGHGDASIFFDGLDIRSVDCTAALSSPDPLRADPPLHPSYEDRPGAPDRVFAAVDDATYRHLVDSWARVLQEADASSATVLHLHHLTPLNAAAALVAPGVPVVGHLHGTELLMLEAIAAGSPAGWHHAAAWADRLRAWAAVCQVLLVPSAGQIPRAQALLGLGPEHFVHLPNGFDSQRFHPGHVNRAAVWRRVLVEHPRGWRPGAAPGSVAYTEAQVSTLADPATLVLLYVGRFTAAKRLDLLLRAYVRARSAFAAPAALVLVGGFPGEWEGEHPAEILRRLGAEARDVFLAGWYDHDELPELFAAGDAIVLASSREAFGQVLVEGMASGLPAIAVAAGGTGELVLDGRTGWLVPPEDEAALAAALVAVVSDADARRRRGAAAAAEVRARYAWPALGARLARLYEQVIRS
jgi:glycosyltransferase involved in cell wall biosynthesis